MITFFYIALFAVSYDVKKQKKKEKEKKTGKKILYINQPPSWPFNPSNPAFVHLVITISVVTHIQSLYIKPYLHKVRMVVLPYTLNNSHPFFTLVKNHHPPAVECLLL
jgi:hypothetical protein